MVYKQKLRIQEHKEERRIDLSQWCYPTISSSVIPFSSCLQSFPASGSFPVSQFFILGGQSIGVSASASVLSMNIQDWFPLGLDLLAVQGILKSLLQNHSSKASILQCSAFFIVQVSHLYMTTGKTIALTRWTFVGKVMSLLFDILSRFVTVFLPRRKSLLISRLQSLSQWLGGHLLFFFSYFCFFNFLNLKLDNCFIILCWFLP